LAVRARLLFRTYRKWSLRRRAKPLFHTLDLL
jgi:hypothetical protein